MYACSKGGTVVMDYKDYRSIVLDYDSMTNLDRSVAFLLAHPYAEVLYNKTGKTPAEYNASELHTFLIGVCQDRAPRTISFFITYFDDFYNYLILHGYRSNNPTKDARNRPAVIIDDCASSQIYYSKDDITYIISSISRSKEFYTALILSFYEGVAQSYSDLESLRFKDIDFDKRTVITQRGSRRISKKLANAYSEMHSLDYLVDNGYRGKGNRRTPCRLVNPGAVFVTTSDQFSSFCSKRFKLVSDMVGLTINRRPLYYDGFINHCVDKIGMENLVNMFKGQRMLKVDTERLRELAEEYGFLHGKNVGYEIKPYIFGMYNRMSLE